MAEVAALQVSAARNHDVGVAPHAPREDAVAVGRVHRYETFFENDPSGGRNRNRPGAGRFVEVPGMDHGYRRYASAEAAFRGEGGVFADDAPAAMVRFLREIAD